MRLAGMGAPRVGVAPSAWASAHVCETVRERVEAERGGEHSQQKGRCTHAIRDTYT
jgi:hypothetical protein